MLVRQKVKKLQKKVLWYCYAWLIILDIARVQTDQCDDSDELIPDFSKLKHNTEDTLFKYGFTRKTWEMDAIALAWRKDDIKDDS